MVDHANVGAFVASRLSHRIREELTTNPNLMTARRRTFDQRPDISVRDRAFHEDGANVARDLQVDKLRDPNKARLTFGGDSLDPEHLEAIGLAEIVKRIMRGQQDAAILGHRGESLPRIG